MLDITADATQAGRRGEEMGQMLACPEELLNAHKIALSHQFHLQIVGWQRQPMIYTVLSEGDRGTHCPTECEVVGDPTPY
jgi:hypothetical protein